MVHGIDSGYAIRNNIVQDNIIGLYLNSSGANPTAVEQNLISSHGEAGRYFVSFLDNHDQNERFHHPLTPQNQVTLGLALLFCLQGIPCVYYGTEQGLVGTNNGAGSPTLGSPMP